MNSLICGIFPHISATEVFSKNRHIKNVSVKDWLGHFSEVELARAQFASRS